MLFHLIGQGKVDQIVEVPAAGAVGHFAGIGLGIQGVLRHEVAVVAQNGFGQADKRLANYQVAECLAIFEHAHEANATDVIACFVVEDAGIGDFARHSLAQGLDLVGCEDGAQVTVTVAVELLDDALGFFRRVRLACCNGTGHGILAGKKGGQVGCKIGHGLANAKSTQERILRQVPLQRRLL